MKKAALAFALFAATATPALAQTAGSAPTFSGGHVDVTAGWNRGTTKDVLPGPGDRHSHKSGVAVRGSAGYDVPLGNSAIVGAEAVSTLHRLRCDVAFVGTNGISVHHGFSTPDHDEAAVKEAMVRAASRVIMLADSSKLGAELLVGFATLSQADVLITDDGIDEADIADLRAAGLEVVIA